MEDDDYDTEQENLPSVEHVNHELLEEAIDDDKVLAFFKITNDN